MPLAANSWRRHKNQQTNTTKNTTKQKIKCDKISSVDGLAAYD